jgi:hypothetical protein
MGNRAPLHRLDNVDLDKQTAVCSACGPTQIIIRSDSKQRNGAPGVRCINRYRQIVRDSQRRRRLQAQLQNPNWQPKHKLSGIDPKKMHGVCAICGPTDILIATIYHNQTFYRCATNFRKYARDYSRSHYKHKS